MADSHPNPEKNHKNPKINVTFMWMVRESKPLTGIVLIESFFGLICDIFSCFPGL